LAASQSRCESACASQRFTQKWPVMAEAAKISMGTV
jgi:hypothetical protein